MDRDNSNMFMNTSLYLQISKLAAQMQMQMQTLNKPANEVCP